MSARLRTEFVGRWRHLCWLALKTSVLTVLTIGFYRFWMKTRLRRWYWSSIRPGGDPLEYTGQPLEKLLGFLIAVVFLAFYLGIVNLILMFGTLSLFNEVIWAYALSFIGVIPLWFYARYRAWRYVLSRTSWRGIRFALSRGAWGYALRALWHWLLTIITLGLLWPRKTFKLEKYLTEHTWFGTQRFTLTGSWTMLWPAAVHVIIGLVLTLGAGALSINDSPGMGLVLFVSVPWLLFGFVYWRVQSFRLLTEAKRAGPIQLVARPRHWRVVRIYLLGGFLTLLALLAILVVIGFALFLVLATTAQSFSDLESVFNTLDMADMTGNTPAWAAAVIGVGGYFAFFLAWGVLTHVFLTLPLMRHYAMTFEIVGAEHLAGVHQRTRDDFSEAEGFAEALDVGAAI